MDKDSRKENLEETMRRFLQTDPKEVKGLDKKETEKDGEKTKSD